MPTLPILRSLACATALGLGLLASPPAATGQVFGEPPQRLASSGSWSAWTMPITITMTEQPGDSLMIFDPICTAQTGTEATAILRIAYMPDGFIAIQVSSPQLNLGRRNADMVLRTPEMALVGNRAAYRQTSIDTVVPAEMGEVYRMHLVTMAASPGRLIDIVDHCNRVLVRFPTNGMREMIDRAKRCVAAQR